MTTPGDTGCGICGARATADAACGNGGSSWFLLFPRGFIAPLSPANLTRSLLNCSLEPLRQIGTYEEVAVDKTVGCRHTDALATRARDGESEHGDTRVNTLAAACDCQH